MGCPRHPGVRSRWSLRFGSGLETAAGRNVHLDVHVLHLYLHPSVDLSIITPSVFLILTSKHLIAPLGLIPALLRKIQSQISW